MNSQRPEDLEKFVHRTLRALPARPAPNSLEGKVMAAIAHRNAQQGQRFGWSSGSTALRIALVFLSIVAGCALCALFWLPWSQPLPAWLPLETSTQIERTTVLVTGVIDAFGAVFRSIPTLWLYGVLGVIAVLYSALFGLGATAYRVLAPQSE